jgi:D-3-phosphoglycerate dehydrogenase
VVRTGLSEDALVEAVPEFDALVVRSQTQVTARVIEAGRNLRVIARAGVGVDNIDLDAATQRGLVVVNAPLANTISAAEHAFALILAAARNVPQSHAALRAGRWERSRYQGVELAGRTLGIVGLGRIGSEVAKRARSFEMRIVAYDPFVSNERAASLGVELCSLDELLEQSDFVSLHTALHDETRGLLGATQFARMKQGAFLVNAARGALVDEQALRDAVESGHLGGAAVDVYSEEPAIGNVLTTSDRIVTTPHLAASTNEAQDRAAIDVSEQVLDVLAGRPARFAVNAPLVDPETMAAIGPYVAAAELAACVAPQLIEGQPNVMRLEYLGDIGNYELGPLRAAAIVGMFERVSVGNVTIVNADQVAAEHGLRVEESRGPARDPYANLVVVEVVTDLGPVSVAATYTSHRPAGVRVVRIDDYEVDISPHAAPYVLAVENVDRPGMIGHVGMLLGEIGVNIDYMSVAAGGKDRALMILGINRALTAEEGVRVARLENIFSVRLLDLS